MGNFKKTVSKADSGLDDIKLKIKEFLGTIDPVIIYPYRGYGNAEEAFLHGRVLEQEKFIHDEDEWRDGLWSNIRKMWKRYESDEIPGVELQAELGGVIASAKSDEEGFFRLHFKAAANNPFKNGWHKVKIRITSMPFDIEYKEEKEAEVMICNQEEGFLIISDVDDTIIRSNAMSGPEKLKTMLKNSARERTPFEGVEELYQEIIRDYKNPLFFISGSSYNLYDMLCTFCDHHNIPRAPFLLRNLGLNPDKWLKQDTAPYKKQNIEEILNLYEKMEVICIGDSGQQDPEIYLDLNKKYPDRIKAIYIRHVHHDERKNELQDMAAEANLPLLIIEHSRDALKHMKGMSWA